MKKSNPLEGISEVLGSGQWLSTLRNSLGIPSFCYESPVGWIDIIVEEDRVFRATFMEEVLFPEPTPPPPLPIFAQTVALLDRYFAGERVDFSGVPVKLIGATDFQQEVWHVIREIPYGEVRTYQWIADRIGRPKSARSVGNATGANPVSILTPCHRVVRSDGTLGGYGGGPGRKRQLLALEGYSVEQLEK